MPALVLIPAVHFGAISEALKTVREICSAISLVVYVPLHSRGMRIPEATALGRELNLSACRHNSFGRSILALYR